ncbi:MAG: FkbM family methyltransferase [Desulfobulbaceae bacterium]
MSDIINLWLDDEYGIRQMNMVPGTVVDIGGNIGLFSLWVWCHFPNTRIYTFEPNPRVFEHLTKNLDPTHAKVRRAGVSFKPGRAEMKDAGDSRLATTILKDDGEIELIPLSQIAEDVGGKIDLLKMDCEGAEWDIFEDKEAFEKIQTIRMEYHLDDTHSVESLRAVTDGLGYRMTHHAPNHGFGIAWFEKN